MSSTQATTVLPPATGRSFKEEPKRILAVVTAGGYTNAAPLMEVAAILAARGHVIEFATLAGRDSWLGNWPFVSRVHLIGHAIPAEAETKAYLRMSQWSSDLVSSWGAVFAAKRFLESTWPDAYRGLTRLVQDPHTRPDFILADYWVEAARDMSVEHDIPVALLWPQMPTVILPAPYIPGPPGLQVNVLSSEFATIWQRLWSEVVIYTSLFEFLSYSRWKRRLRASEGVKRQFDSLAKPEYLCLVNSFFGLEVAKDVPPNVVAIGPLVPDEVPVLTEEPYVSFLSTRSRVAYMALGTHVLFSHGQLLRLLSGTLVAMSNGTIDGIIWALHEKARIQLDHSATIAFSPGPRKGPRDSNTSVATETLTVGQVLSNVHPSILVCNFAPQRSLLEDPRVSIFISHAGPSSANEAVLAGIPLVTLPVYFDQVQNSMRLRDAGVAVPLEKDRFTAADVTLAVTNIMDDVGAGGPIAANVERLRGIARVAARRKHLGADLVEEMILDWQGRRKERDAQARAGISENKRGMHLQTADARMPVWKAKNWDLLGVVAAATLVVVGGVIAIVVPLVRRFG